MHRNLESTSVLFQLVSTLLSQDIVYKWPLWVEISTFVSHLLLAVCASINILLYCLCDKRFFVVVQKTLKTWFVWPLTTKERDMVRHLFSSSISIVSEHILTCCKAGSQVMNC